MRKEIVAGAFVGIFCLGIFVGSFLGKGSNSNSKNTSESETANAEDKSKRGQTDLDSSARKSGADGTQGSGTKQGPGNGQNPNSGFQSDHPGQRANRVMKPLIENPMATPTNLTGGALREGEVVKRELDESNGKGNGRVSTLVYDFDSPEDKAKWEEKRRKRWQSRLEHEITVKLNTLKAKVGLTASQGQDLTGILRREKKERMRLVDLLTAKQISRTSFDDGVQKNVKTAKAAVKGLLSQQQWAAYQKLDPREQVLRDEVK